MTREEGYLIVTTLIKNPNLIKHHLAAEVVMRALAQKFKTQNPGSNIDEEKWALVGLLHDADYEMTRDHPEKHTIILEERIGKNLDPEIMYAIKCHNFERLKIKPKSLMDWSIYACDELTGLIIAATLVHPDRKLSALTTDFILNRFKEKSFAKGANRNQILMCEPKLNIPLNEFVEIALIAMQSISSELGL